MIRAVLDCNVVITAALSGGKCAELLLRARTRGGFYLVWSPPIVAECLRVIESADVHTVDITGGAPELHKRWRELVERSTAAGKRG